MRVSVKKGELKIQCLNFLELNTLLHLIGLKSVQRYLSCLHSIYLWHFFGAFRVFFIFLICLCIFFVEEVEESSMLGFLD